MRFVSRVCGRLGRAFPREAGCKRCSVVSGLRSCDRKSVTLTVHSGLFVTCGYNTNHQATNVRMNVTGTRSFSYGASAVTWL
jgi:hypothetical protein